MNEGLADGALVARGSVAPENVAARSGQKTLLMAVDDSVALDFGVATVAAAAKVRSVQVTGDAISQRSTSARGACQEVEFDGVEAGPGTFGQKTAAVADAVASATLDQMRSDMTEKTENAVEKLQMVNSSLQGELVVKTMAHARALMDIIHFQRNRKKAVKKKGGCATFGCRKGLAGKHRGGGTA